MHYGSIPMQHSHMKHNFAAYLSNDFPMVINILKALSSWVSPHKTLSVLSGNLAKHSSAQTWWRFKFKYYFIH